MKNKQTNQLQTAKNPTTVICIKFKARLLEKCVFPQSFLQFVSYIRNKGVISSCLITSWEQENADHPFCSSECQDMASLDLSLLRGGSGDVLSVQ